MRYLRCPFSAIREKVYAEYASVPASQLALKPADISHEEAAAACLAALTAWQALTINYKLNPGERVLIMQPPAGWDITPRKSPNTSGLM